MANVELPKPIQRAALESTRFPWRQYLDALRVPAALPLAQRARMWSARTSSPTYRLRSSKATCACCFWNCRRGFSARRSWRRRRPSTGPPPSAAGPRRRGGAEVRGTNGEGARGQLAAAQCPAWRRKSEAIAREMFRAMRDGFGKSMDAAEWLDPISRRPAREDRRARAPSNRRCRRNKRRRLRRRGRRCWRRCGTREVFLDDACGAVRAHPEGESLVPPSFDVGAFYSRSNAIWLSPEIVRPPFLQGGAGDPISMVHSERFSDTSWRTCCRRTPGVTIRQARFAKLGRQMPSARSTPGRLA